MGKMKKIMIIRERRRGRRKKMKEPSIILGIFLVVLLLFCFLGSAPKIGEYRKTIEIQEQEIRELKEQIVELEKQNTDTLTKILKELQ